jgi:hypothetical protein
MLRQNFSGIHFVVDGLIVPEGKDSLWEQDTCLKGVHDYR